MAFNTEMNPGPNHVCPTLYQVCHCDHTTSYCTIVSCQAIKQDCIMTADRYFEQVENNINTCHI